MPKHAGATKKKGTGTRGGIKIHRERPGNVGWWRKEGQRCARMSHSGARRFSRVR